MIVQRSCRVSNIVAKLGNALSGIVDHGLRGNVAQASSSVVRPNAIHFDPADIIATAERKTLREEHEHLGSS